VSDFYPLAENAGQLADFYARVAPPDRRGAADEITSADVAPGPGVTIRQDDHEPIQRPTVVVQGGDDPCRRSRVRVPSAA
jgi:hypothetical protein